MIEEEVEDKMSEEEDVEEKIRDRINSLNKEIGTPWFVYIMGGSMLFMTSVLLVEAIRQSMDLMNRIANIILFSAGVVVSLGFIYFFYNYNRSNERELERLKKVAEELYRQRRKQEDEESGTSKALSDNLKT